MVVCGTVFGKKRNFVDSDNVASSDKALWGRGGGGFGLNLSLNGTGGEGCEIEAVGWTTGLGGGGRVRFLVEEPWSTGLLRAPPEPRVTTSSSTSESLKIPY